MNHTHPIEYIWVGGNQELRSKTRIIHSQGLVLDDFVKIPDWNYDGSSTNQATGTNSEIIIKPRTLFKDPFRKGGYMVICDTYTPEGEPVSNNTRHNANNIFNQK